jgi:hypothetical protein
VSANAPAAGLRRLPIAEAIDPKITADDTEGHTYYMADAEQDETEDTDGHRMAADAEADEDDVEGHIKAR